MTTVSVLVPWRGGCPHREAAWQYVQRWWTTRHDSWQLVCGTGPDEPAPWVKALAVADAINRADGDVFIVADADVICEGVGQAVAAVRAGAPWAIPHRGVHRLSEQVTMAVLAGEPLPEVGARRLPSRQMVESYTGVAGGGLVVLPRSLYEQVPLDSRFAGWGQEDAAWGHALTVMVGGSWRGTAALYHLWHPPAQRRSRAIGNPDSLALHRRYRHTATRAAMALLLAEAKTACYPA